MMEIFKKNNINFAMWNIEGLRLGDENSKLNDARFISFVKNNDIVGIAETHCSAESNINIDGYKCFKLS